MRLTSILLAVLALAVAGCGGDDNSTTDTTSSVAESAPADTQAETTPSDTGGAQPGKAADIKASPTKSLKLKPRIPRQAGDPPSTLVKQDIVSGTGATAT